MVWENSVPEGYASFGDRDYESSGGNPLGYAEAGRLAFLRLAHVDPVDLCTKHLHRHSRPCRCAGLQQQFSAGARPVYQVAQDAGWSKGGISGADGARPACSLHELRLAPTAPAPPVKLDLCFQLRLLGRPARRTAHRRVHFSQWPGRSAVNGRRDDGANEVRACIHARRRYSPHPIPSRIPGKESLRSR